MHWKLTRKAPDPISNTTRKKIDERKLREIVFLLFEERKGVREIADLMGVSHMTVYRALQNAEYLSR